MKNVTQHHNLKTTAILFIALLCIINLKANTYYSLSSLDASMTSTWCSCRCGVGTFPTSFSGSDTFVIQNSHVLYTGSHWNLTGVNSAIIIENRGILKSNDSISVHNSTVFNIKDGGTYIHMNSSYAPTRIFNGIEIFEAKSNVEISRWMSPSIPITVASFGNLKITYNNLDIWNQQNNILEIKGNFLLDNNSTYAFQFANNSDYTLNIGRNITIKTGLFNFSGPFTRNYQMNIKGGFNQIGGICANAPGSASSSVWTMNFTGDSSFFYRSGGIYVNAKINTRVDVNARLFMSRTMVASNGRTFNVYGSLICDTFKVRGTGTFELFNYASLHIASDSGITRASSLQGNIVTATRRFNTGAKYIYYGRNHQSTGNGLPNVVRVLKTNMASGTSKLVFNRSITVTDTLALLSGILRNDTQNIILGTSPTSIGVLVHSNGYIDGVFSRYFAAATNSGMSGYFPIGFGSFFRPAKIEYNIAPSVGGLVKSRFIQEDPGDAGLPLIETGVSLMNANNSGFWKMEVVNGNFSAGEYTATIYPNDFADIIDAYLLHLITRPNSGLWALDGTHVPSYGTISSPVVMRSGMTKIQEFGLAGSDNLTPLPVSWNSFDVIQSNDDALLNWSTNVEVNNNHFEIERSWDAQNFTKIAEVTGAGNSSSVQSYHYNDAQILKTNASVVYYRIKQVDNDGQFDYSAIKYLNIDPANSENSVSVNVFPNPSSDYAQYNSNKEIQTLQLLSLNGAEIMRTDVHALNGQMNLMDLQPALYIVKLTFADNSTASVKLIKN